MAANNYFGFTHGGTQYGAATGAAYGGQTGYAVAPAPAAATYGTQRAAAGYDPAYQAAAATQAAHAHAAAAAASAYDASKTAYYQQAAAYPAAHPAHAAPPPTYDTPKPAYTAHSPAYQGARPAKPYAYSAPAAAGSGTYAAQYSQTQTKTAAARPHAYDAALYNAATMYVAQQGKTGTAGGGGGGAGGAAGWKPYGKGGPTVPRRPKPPPKAQQLHYCDVCRISCAGPQTYKEHLEGQKHKKKEAAAKLAAAGAAAAAGRAAGAAALRCELCDVTCTGADAYAAHVRGIKHQKVVKLHTMLGKPIPSAEPVKVPGAPRTVGGAAKIAFVASGGLSTVVGPQGDKEPAPEPEEEPEPDVQPVGQDYIEEIRGDDGKPLSFNCKLCDCRFNDPNAKEMHMKGRRHRLQYKKKVQPDLVVVVKTSVHQRKLAEQKAARLQAREDMWARRRHDDDDERWRGGAHPAHGAHPPHAAQPPRRDRSADDRHVMAKHAAVYPAERDLQDLTRLVAHTERALRALSDELAGQAHGPAHLAGKEDGRDNQLLAFGGEEGDGAPRALRGVMRVGLLAKGLLLRGERAARLVVVCGARPTVTLLKRVAAALPAHLAALAPQASHKYRVELRPADGAALVADPATGCEVRVALTSPLMRDNAESGDDKDVLPRGKCLDALAALRHAKWFQARAASLPSAVIVIRVLRDLCRRIPTWTPLDPYAMELLVAGVVGSAGAALSPAEALRRVLEAVAGGLLLDAAPGLRDPCEKDPLDALRALPPQSREDITASAQHFLRQLAFRQIYRVLDMDPLPGTATSADSAWRQPRKRRRSHSDVDGEGKIVKTEDKPDSTEVPTASV